MKILNFNDFIKESFIHSGLWTKNEIIDLRDLDFIFEQSSESVKKLNKLLSKNKDKQLKLFHGTHPDIQILEEGLLKTTLKTKKSYQSETGYVYLSIYPESAKLFGDLAYGIQNSTVYEINVPILYCKPDLDQLRNVNLESPNVYGKTLGDSIIYGNGVRVKGNIPPYMIKIFKK